MTFFSFFEKLFSVLAQIVVEKIHSLSLSLSLSLSARALSYETPGWRASEQHKKTSTNTRRAKRSKVLCAR
jgi:hypothetical protein